MVIAAGLKEHGVRESWNAPADEASGLPISVRNALGARASRLRLRRGQTIGLDLDSGAIFIVSSGALMLRVAMPDTARQILSILLPGDLVRSSLVPPLADAHLAAASPSEVWRLRRGEAEDAVAHDPGLARYIESALAQQMTRQWLHLSTIARFTGEQRVATMVLELALRSAKPSPSGGFALEMPFTRTNVADYLCLNPDTLSRIMSRLRRMGVLGHSERSKIIVRDAAALTRLSPAANSLAALYRDRRIEPKPGHGA